MCGPDTSNRPRGGALAALASPPTSTSPLNADLAFHTPNMPSCSTATHARLTPSASWKEAQLSDLYVVVQYGHPNLEIMKDRLYANTQAVRLVT